MIPLCALALLMAVPAWADDDFDHCLEQLRAQAPDQGVSVAAFDRFTAGVAPDPSVLEALDYQPEFVTPIWDYMAALVDEERIADGRAMLAQWREVLDRVEATYGVDRHVVVAVWGVESNYGRNFGKRPLVTSLATLSCEGRRQGYFRGEFFTTLKILAAGHMAPERLTGSWAGAFGHTQFMPSTFMRTAVDFDGDGRRDLIDSVPDALASTANYLKQAGWRSGEGWGYEIRLPAGFDASIAGRKARRSVSAWAAMGLRRIDGSALEAIDDTAAVLLPAGAEGPAFLVFRNFNAIYSYNAAESYALAIAHLSDRLRGGGPFVTPWPTDDPGIARKERRELQQLLIDRGHDVGEVDGVIGSRTRAAIEAEQARLGFEVNGRAGMKILKALRAKQ
ncbi:lytic murein transglycosylase [Nitrogeniibacter mangrovi]|uniref:Lytic murein transglycosylase n=1 Tax=Nitrogeniibacter mangrovi TaxID=2016596 RepID=A0A6C1B888_9RHOO|nr:lytic murein transglycosylase [Nitrogeniibacter mangrovi]QID19697.1 lytic murein transglycosylase [Nitrogeniibacter mangrovi]